MCVCRSFCCRTRLSGVCRRRREWLVQHRRPATSVTLSWAHRLVGSVVFSGHGIRLHGQEFDSRPLRLILGWVTIFGRTNHLGISPSHSGQLSLLSSAGRVISTIQSAVTLCGWVIKAGMAHSTCG